MADSIYIMDTLDKGTVSILGRAAWNVRDFIPLLRTVYKLKVINWFWIFHLIFGDYGWAQLTKLEKATSWIMGHYSPTFLQVIHKFVVKEKNKIICDQVLDRLWKFWADVSYYITPRVQNDNQAPTLNHRFNCD